MAITAYKVALRQLQANKALTAAPTRPGSDPFHQALQQAEARTGNSFKGLAGMETANPADYIRQLSTQLASGNGGQEKEAGLISQQQIDMIKNLARLQVMSLNQTLIEAFSGSTGSGGLDTGNSFMSVMAGLLQTVQSRPPQPPTNIPGAYRTQQAVQPENPAGSSEAPLTEPEKETPNPSQILTEKSQKNDAVVKTPEPEEPAITASRTSAAAVPKIPAADGDVDGIIEETASKYGLDPNLVKAVVKTESNFNPQAVSSAGAMGLMQLMPKTAAGLGVKDAFDPVQNINGGAKYLKQMLDRYHGKIDHALAAYNWGPGNFDRSEGRYMPRETRNYIRIVNKHLKNFSAADQA